MGSHLRPPPETSRIAIERVIPAPRPIDLKLTLAPLRHGNADPTIVLSASEAWRATRTPEGPATLHLEVGEGAVRAEAWGPGAGWALETCPELIGQHDRHGWAPPHSVVRELHRRLRGLRVSRSSAVFEVLVPTIIEQRVSGADARRSYRRLVRRYGEPAPGPCKLSLQPTPDTLAALPYHSFHPFGIERSRAEILKRAASRASRLEEVAGMGREDAIRRLTAIQGIGQWSASYVRRVALGDPDAVIVGDLNLPQVVSWVLAREPHGSDTRMLELLDPFQGERGRTMLLIEASGIRPPPAGPGPARSGSIVSRP